jgi:uncharacterized membrane protein (UPF0127 family)
MYAIASINNVKLALKKLNDTKSKQKGFMGWTKSPNNHYGLIFMNEEPKIQSYWMHTVPFDLEALGFDSENNLIEIIQLKSFDQISRKFKNPVCHVVEVCKDWCKNNNIKLGSKLLIKDL